MRRQSLGKRCKTVLAIAKLRHCAAGSEPGKSTRPERIVNNKSPATYTSCPWKVTCPGACPGE
ncbi:uncharacterized protein METZ01_LOCUS239969 [marine metagenome]|uniref:Uncharacterized protein n=1 Tax=marine metagenome TaxID=408172 RepID=A0A382HJ71_9ZZZZ